MSWKSKGDARLLEYWNSKADASFFVNWRFKACASFFISWKYKGDASLYTSWRYKADASFFISWRSKGDASFFMSWKYKGDARLVENGRRERWLERTEDSLNFPFNRPSVDRSFVSERNLLEGRNLLERNTQFRSSKGDARLLQKDWQWCYRVYVCQKYCSAFFELKLTYADYCLLRRLYEWIKYTDWDRRRWH